MSSSLKIISILFCLIIIGIVLYIVKKGRISIKYSLIWFFSMFILLLLILIPNLLGFFTNLIGIEVASNLIFALIIAVLIFISISLTIIVSGQNDKIRLLVQEISLLKSKDGKKWKQS